MRSTPSSATKEAKRSREEIMAIIKAAQDELQAANPTGRDLLQELIDERRAEAARE